MGSPFECKRIKYNAVDCQSSSIGLLSARGYSQNFTLKELTVTSVFQVSPKRGKHRNMTLFRNLEFEGKRKSNKQVMNRDVDATYFISVHFSFSAGRTEGVWGSAPCCCIFSLDFCFFSTLLWWIKMNIIHNFWPRWTTPAYGSIWYCARYQKRGMKEKGVKFDGITGILNNGLFEGYICPLHFALNCWSGLEASELSQGIRNFVWIKIATMRKCSYTKAP